MAKEQQAIARIEQAYEIAHEMGNTLIVAYSGGKDSNSIARVFPRRTSATPDDDLSFINCPPPLLTLPEIREAHVSVAFTWDLPRAEQLARQWEAVGVPVKIGGPAFNEPGGDFVPGLYLRRGNVITSRGCPNRCLHGDTPILTTDGIFHIRDLVGKSIRVLTRSDDGKPIFAPVSQVKQTGANERLVRVCFDDGSHIDCTPDHLFKRFKNGNQYVAIREYDVEAQNLKRGDSVVAVKLYARHDGYSELNYGRHYRALLHRLIAESDIGRKIDESELVHHIDHDKSNNVSSNLIVISARDHFSQRTGIGERSRLVWHPEISERMRLSNPARNMTDEWREKISKAGLGIKRTLEQRERYRLSKLGSKNPNYKPELHQDARVNHKVTGVEWLGRRADTYCMEVPGYNWFFANNVLVHNCWFCAVPKREGGVLRELPITNGWNVLDDNLLACSDSHIRAVFEMLKRQPERPRFTGGLEAKLLREWHVELLRSVRTDRMYFAYDTPDDYEPLVEAGKLLRAGGFSLSSHKAACYVLIGYRDDTFDAAEARLCATAMAGFVPYAMLWRCETSGTTNDDWKQFYRSWSRPQIVGAKMAALLRQQERM
jgi:hypothetical protein